MHAINQSPELLTIKFRNGPPGIIARPVPEGGPAANIAQELGLAPVNVRDLQAFTRTGRNFFGVSASSVAVWESFRDALAGSR